MKRFVLPILVISAAGFFPLLASARPPLIFHRVTRLTYRPGERLKIRLSMQDVEIKVGRSDSVRISSFIWASVNSRQARERLIHHFAPAVIQKENAVQVASRRHGGWHWSFNWGESLQAREVVTIPPTMAVRYQLGSGDFRFDNPGSTNSIRGFSGSGDVLVRSHSSHLVIRAGSGDARVFLGGHAQVLSVVTGSGDIELVGGARKIQLKAGSGDVEVHAGLGHMASIESGSGDIVARWRAFKSGGAIRVATGSGDVSMVFPEGTVLGGLIETASGDVKSAFPVSTEQGHHTYVLGGGRGAIHFHATTGSGDVSVETR